MEERRFDGEMDAELERWLGDAFETWLPSGRAVAFRDEHGVELIARAGNRIVRLADGLSLR